MHLKKVFVQYLLDGFQGRIPFPGLELAAEAGLKARRIIEQVAAVGKLGGIPKNGRVRLKEGRLPQSLPAKIKVIADLSDIPKQLAPHTAHRKGPVLLHIGAAPLQAGFA